MPWNTIFPDGSKSVKQNETPGQQNTTYIKTTMNNDHYWDIGSNEDGRHKYVNMPTQASNPSIATGMNGIMFLKSDGTRIQGFYRNNTGTVADDVYQFIPAFKSGTANNITNSFSDVAAVPANVYGEIKMFITAANGNLTVQDGFFKSSGTAVSINANRYIDASGSSVSPLRFTGTLLMIRARIEDAPSGQNWAYRITYRAI